MYNLLFVSLGCDKNLVDTEKMLGILLKDRFKLTDDEFAADVIVVNTCCFINDAKQESINTIIEMANYKKTGNCKALIVTGCLSERYQDEITKEIEEVDAILGTSSYESILEAVEKVLSGNKFSEFKSLNNNITKLKERFVTTGGYYAHLKIAEGCDKCCTYCIIPKIRGHYKSVPMQDLIEEATSLAKNGVKELILVAQETTLYGTDIYGKKSLHILIQELSKIEGIKWIRILYLYPEEIYDELIEEMKVNEKVCKYVDMPIQHASDKILKLMGRRTNNEQLRNTIYKLRKEIPEIAIRTTLITGFPGETQEDFETLYNFVDGIEFDRLGIFTYSAEENTPAALMDNQIDEEIKKSRRDELMELQQEIAFEHSEAMIGKDITVIIDGKLVEEDVYSARTYMDSPNVDGAVFIDTEYDLISGDFYEVSIISATGYDLVATIKRQL